MGSMQQLCTKGILLDNGCISFSGNICETVNVYQSGIVLQKEFVEGEGVSEILQLLYASVKSSDYNGFDLRIYTNNKNVKSTIYISDVKIEQYHQ